MGNETECTFPFCCCFAVLFLCSLKQQSHSRPMSETLNDCSISQITAASMLPSCAVLFHSQHALCFSESQGDVWLRECSRPFLSVFLILISAVPSTYASSFLMPSGMRTLLTTPKGTWKIPVSICLAEMSSATVAFNLNDAEFEDSSAP